jgi:hypothetical protein
MALWGKELSSLGFVPVLSLVSSQEVGSKELADVSAIAIYAAGLFYRLIIMGSISNI